MSGSGLFSKQMAAIPHSMGREVADLRTDVQKTFASMAAIGVDEYTNPAAAAPAGLLAATASTVAVQTYHAADLLSPGKAALLAFGRNVTFTTAGGTAADAPASVVVVGTGMDGKSLTETVSVAQTATVANGVKVFKTITSITYAAGDGAGATVSIGFGLTLGLSKKVKTRAGGALAIKEITDGALPTAGVISATNSSYTPNTAPDGAHDYAVYYEYDPTASY